MHSHKPESKTVENDNSNANLSPEDISLRNYDESTKNDNEIFNLADFSNNNFVTID